MNKPGRWVLPVLLACCSRAAAQNPTLTITSSNIASEVSLDLNTLSAPCLLSVAPYVKVRATGNFSPVAVPLNKVRTTVVSIDGLNLLGASTEQPVGTSDATMYTALAGLLGTTGTVLVRYRIPVTEMTNYAWNAGTNTTDLIFTTPGSTLCLGTATFTRTLSLVVQPFLVAPATTNLTLSVNNLNFFRSSTISNSHNIVATTTVAQGIRLKTGATNFAFTNGYSGATDPLTAVSNVQAQITGQSAINLSTTLQNLSPSGGFAVTTGNTRTSAVNFSIAPATLKTSFIKKGTYTSNLSYEVFDARVSPALTAVPLTATLTVDVADMGEIAVNNTSVNVNFTTPAHYASGASTEMPAHLTVSKTTAYSVTVRANAAVLTSGSNTLPVGILNIGPATGQTGITPITLSTTAQKIIDGAAPEIDRSIGLKFSVPASQLSQVLNKPAGDYTVTLTYTLIAP
jgi:hypothetical protein